MRRAVVTMLLATQFISGCASTSPLPSPIIAAVAPTPGDHDDDPSAEIRACRRTVLEAAPVTMQPRWLPPIMAPNGVVVATAVKPQPVRLSPAAYREHMEHCLLVRGYEIHAWE
jgi:hypothetical protein